MGGVGRMGIDGEEEGEMWGNGELSDEELKQKDRFW